MPKKYKNVINARVIKYSRKILALDIKYKYKGTMVLFIPV